MHDDPKLYIGLAAAVVGLAVRQLESAVPKHRRMARAWFLIEPNPERSFWISAAGLDEDALLERLYERGLLEPEEETDGGRKEEPGG